MAPDREGLDSVCAKFALSLRQPQHQTAVDIDKLGPWNSAAREGRLVASPSEGAARFFREPSPPCRSDEEYIRIRTYPLWQFSFMFGGWVGCLKFLTNKNKTALAVDRPLGCHPVLQGRHGDLSCSTLVGALST